jgi:hypothetical protein
MRNAGTVFECEWVELRAGSQGWAKPYFPSWEAERIANSMPDRFRVNDSLMGPEGMPGNWEYLTEEGGEWLPVEWVEDHGVGKWNMDPQAEWRVVSMPEPGDDEAWEAVVELAKAVHKAQEDHCDLSITAMNYGRVRG